MENKHPRSEIEHLLRVLEPSSGDRLHKEEKNIYLSMTMIKFSLSLIFVLFMNVSTIPVFKVAKEQH